MHPQTPNVLPKHLICRTCRKIRTTLHMPCLLVLPSRTNVLMVLAIFLKNMVTYAPPTTIHLRQARFKVIPKRYDIPPPYETGSNRKKGQHWQKSIKSINDPPPGFRTYIYTQMYTTLPNSTWFHHRSLRCVQSVQFCAYMWLRVLNEVKAGSKWAKMTLEEHIFHTFLTPFLVPKRALFKVLPDI